MQQPKGIIMQVSDSYAIVMTPDRQFRRVPVHAGMTIGQEIEIPKEEPRFKIAWRKFAMVAASLALAVGLWQASVFLQPEQVSAYVALDINPSLELSINKDKEVLQVTPLNEDAETLIKNLKLKGKSVEEAVNDVAIEATKLGYIKPQVEILVTAADAGDSTVDLKALEQTVMQTMQVSLRERGIASNVGGVLVTQKEREEAKRLGLTPGKYALYVQAQASAIDIALDDLKQQSVSNIAIKHGEDVKEIVAGMKGDKKLADLVHEITEKQSSLLSNRKNDEKDEKNNGKVDNQTPPGNGNGNVKNGDNKKEFKIENPLDSKEKNREDKDKKDKDKSKEKDDAEHDKEQKNGEGKIPFVPSIPSIPSIPSVPDVNGPKLPNLIPSDLLH